jgi:leucyl-tRNA synthetase
MKKYNPQEIEKKWQKKWEKDKIYEADDFDKKPFRQAQGKPKYYALIEFPYLSGDGLHVGHVRSYTAIDIVARKRRMEGYNTLYPVGWDAFGLPAENYAIKTGIHPRETTKKNADTFRRQLKSLGFSFDWNREISTADPEYYKWTQWMFLQFFKHGLAYKANVPINWCKSCKIGLANEEVVDNKCERCGGEIEKRNKDQWMIRITEYADRLLEGLKNVDYIERARIQQENWIGKSEGALIEFRIKNNESRIEVFTTRPDTLFGATYMVLAPEHPLIENLESRIQNLEEVNKYIDLAKKKTEIERTAEDKDKTGVELKGIKAINPANKEEIPIFVADYVLIGYGTGAIMAVPAHDERDFEFAKKHNLKIRHVVEPKFVSTSGESGIKEGLPFMDRNAVCVIVRNPKDDTYLCIKWKTVHMHGLVTGGVDNNEDFVEAARREVLEETGYKNLKLAEDPKWIINTFFYHRVKKENRHARFHYVFFDLLDDERDAVSEKEATLHEIVWKKKNELKDFFTVFEGDFTVTILENPDYVHTGQGLLTHSGEFNSMDSEKAIEAITRKYGVPKVEYKLRDWVFSRQRYWGEPIPLVFCEHCVAQIDADKKSAQINADNPRKSALSEGELLNPGWFAVEEKDLPIKLPDVKNYKPTDTGESPLAAIESFVNTTCPKCGGPAKRETDVMPNWAGSSWYFISYCIAENLKSQIPISKQITSSEIQNKLKHWMPIDWYNGGMEHTVLHLLYSRFWNMFLHDIGVVPTSEPYKKRTSHGFILGEGGIKMSKSKGNVVNPDDLVSEFGADSLRLYEMFIGPFDQMVAWDPRGILGPERFLKRVWGIGTTRIKNPPFAKAPTVAEALADKSVGRQESSIKNEKLEGLLHRTIKKVSDDIENMSFNTAVSALMIFANACAEQKEVPVKIWKKFLIILAPFAPHITEELYQLLESSNSQILNPKFSSVHEKSWPEYEEKLAKKENFELIIQVNGKMRGKISAEVGLTEEKARALAEKEIQNWLGDKEIKKVIFVKDRLINFIV